MKRVVPWIVMVFGFLLLFIFWPIGLVFIAVGIIDLVLIKKKKENENK